jgi:hypothetical protein
MNTNNLIGIYTQYFNSPILTPKGKGILSEIFNKQDDIESEQNVEIGVTLDSNNSFIQLGDLNKCKLILKGFKDLDKPIILKNGLQEIPLQEILKLSFSIVKPIKKIEYHEGYSSPYFLIRFLDKTQLSIYSDFQIYLSENWSGTKLQNATLVIQYVMSRFFDSPNIYTLGKNLVEAGIAIIA